MICCPHFLVSRRRPVAAAFAALTVLVPPSGARAQGAAAPPALEKAAGDVLSAPPLAPAAADSAAAPAEERQVAAEPARRAAPGLATLRRRPMSLRDIFGEDLEGSAVLVRPVEGLFSARLPAFLAPDSLRLRPAPSGRQTAIPGDRVGSGYTLGGNLRASFAYGRARVFPTAPSQVLREYRFLDFSSGADRDVLGLMMAWSWQKSQLDLGYRLESSRGGELGEGRTWSSLVAGQGVDHALTLGVTRRWGGADGGE